VKSHSIAIIGGGPAGYVTAIRMKQYGINVTLFEKKKLGGVCLNRGCIPTKALVKIADLYREIKHSNDFGINIENFDIDYSKIYQRKNSVVEKLVSGVEFIFKKMDISLINEQVTSIKKDSKGFIVKAGQEMQFTHVIIATGSVPKELPTIKFDHENILSSTDILNLQELPPELTVIGGGVIGSEFASIMSQLGVKVEIVEFLPNLVPFEDEEISKRLALALKKNGIKVHLKTAVESIKKENNKLILNLSTGKTIETGKVLLSVGRMPSCDIDLSELQISFNKGAIEIDDNFMTSEPNIFAIGDVTAKQMLAHTASKQGLILADFIMNTLKGNSVKSEEIKYENIPRCTFTYPEIASVGLTEAEAKEKLGDILIGKFPFSANGKALGLGDPFGFVKAIADASTDQIIGLHIIGPAATELIAQGALIIGSRMKINDVNKTVFAHPTLSECIAESVEALHNLSIHTV